MHLHALLFDLSLSGFRNADQSMRPAKWVKSQTIEPQCDRIAHKLNTRPRKRYKYRTPEELFI